MNTPKLYSATEVGINRESISEKALKVVSDLQQAGFQTYLVGGCVRDLLLGKKPKDFDVATSAKPEQVKDTFRNSRIIGRRFRLVHVRFGYEVIEVATFRAGADDREEVGLHEMSEGDQGQLLRDNVYGTLEEDVMRRDFRVNALYFDPVKGEILDFVGGIDDLGERKLCSIGESKQRFREDPVRMLRVIRFAAKLDFAMEVEALEMIQEEGKLLSHVSPARLFEEVLKLFHGGAAYETYLMLRKYGLFKYLFPFTDQGVLEDVEGMPERALKNTDKRVRQGKPVIPAFLFACLMWDPVRADARILMNDGTSELQAWRIAMTDALRDQNQYVAVPRRLAEIILDIWNIQFRLAKRNPRMIEACLSNRRFRAAYDFLLLRAALYEIDEEIAEWWTQIQDVDVSERKQMIVELGQQSKNDLEFEEMEGETNGNSVNYKGGQATGKRSAKGHAKQGKQGQRKKPGSGGKSAGAQKQNSKRSAKPKANGGKKAVAHEAGKKNNAGKGKTSNKNASNGRKKGGASAGKRSEVAYLGSPPKDEYGDYQQASAKTTDEKQKKVKVRRKRKVLGRQADMNIQNKSYF